MPKTNGTVYVNTLSSSIQSESIHSEKKIHKDEERKKLDDLSKESETLIYQTSAVFPFDFFPNKVQVGIQKITIIRNSLFTRKFFPILIEDILTVKLNRGLFFASLLFEVRGYEQNPGAINFLLPSEARKIRSFIVGIIAAKKENIDLSVIPIEELKAKLFEIGRTHEAFD